MSIITGKIHVIEWCDDDGVAWHTVCDSQEDADWNIKFTLDHQKPGFVTKVRVYVADVLVPEWRDVECRAMPVVIDETVDGDIPL